MSEAICTKEWWPEKSAWIYRRYVRKRKGFKLAVEQLPGQPTMRIRMPWQPITGDEAAAAITQGEFIHEMARRDALNES